MSLKCISNGFQKVGWHIRGILSLRQWTVAIDEVVFREDNFMDAMTFTRATQNLAETMQRVCDDHVPVIVTREDEPAVVIMSLEDYRALDETAYLLRSPKNAQRLLESVAQLESGKGIVKEIIE